MLVTAACSACGRSHVRNDDRIVMQDHVLEGAEAPGSEAGVTTSYLEPPLLSCVFDGVGGSVRGDRAAQSAADSLRAHVNLPLKERLARCAADVLQGQEGLEHGERAFTVGAGVSIERLDGTLLAARIFHMGDCRVYRFREGALDLLTKDHSLAQRFKDELGADAEVPRNIAHVVTTYAGGDIDDPFEISHPIYFDPGDTYLLCSDGFWEHAGLEETTQALVPLRQAIESAALPGATLTSDQLQESLLDAARNLVHAAQRNGSPDDVSVALIWNAPVAFA